MTTVTIDLPEGAFSALRRSPTEFAREMRIAAAVQWYAKRELSQERAAELAGLSRLAFVDALGRYGVSPFQADAAELVREAMDG